MYDVIGIKLVSNSDELRQLLDSIIPKLEERISKGELIGTVHSPRVLRVIEEAEGAVVAMEACSGMKG